ncbi:hypothetical protein DFO66_10171 [Brevibacterium sanguinis]|uniref:Uncharacterized protein n=2 Tax=Brevibacterium TaxID=1696 RepID=A0A366IQF0_9MICO|nr:MULTISPECIES: hypothetical protein [Brevibacterium]RBP67851.1 hypothetical protein DFO66_10171 [Brevibacterium sanguinis]RBP74732.1 hypothetical protein DFO65_101458 [Brevibacterium celere]
MARFALIPASPVLLDGVDRLETPRLAGLRASIEDVLRTSPRWSLPVADLPPLAGLGGYGIDRGIDTRSGELLVGDDWIEAVGDLGDDERAAAESAHPGIGITLLHAHAAGVSVGALADSGDLIIPLDLSAAAGEDSPLAPVPGATAFDAAVIEALGAADVPALLDLIAGAADVHADLTLLHAALNHLGERPDRVFDLEKIVFDEDVHDVRSLCGTGRC